MQTACAGSLERDEICLPQSFSTGPWQAEEEIRQVGTLGGSGGVIVMNRDGTPAFAMNTSGMYRGAVSASEPARVAIYGDEDLRP